MLYLTPEIDLNTSITTIWATSPPSKTEIFFKGFPFLQRKGYILKKFLTQGKKKTEHNLNNSPPCPKQNQKNAEANQSTQTFSTI